MTGLILALALAQSVDAGVPADAPLAVQKADGTLVMNAAAAKQVDDELKRLQAVEQTHKGESWPKAILLSGAVGLVVGAVAAGLIVHYTVK